MVVGCLADKVDLASGIAELCGGIEKDSSGK